MKEYDVIIVGGGPGGYAAAVSAGLSGLSAALVEKENIGGTCVNWGCIPTKALLRYAKLRRSGADVSYGEAVSKSLKIARERRDAIVTELRRLGVDIYTDTAYLTSPGQVTLKYSCKALSGKNIIIATGSGARRLPGVPRDDTCIVTSREALNFSEAPKSVVVVGSGATGIELACVWNAFGARVTVLEALDNIMGTDDGELSGLALAHYAAIGMSVKTRVAVQSIAAADAGVQVSYSDAAGSHTITAEKVLMAVGVAPNSAGLGLEAAGIETVRGAIAVDGNMSTNVPGIYAVGDVTGKLALAFTATLQGKCAVAAITGQQFKPIAYEHIPRCIFSDIEAAYVGLNAAQAAARGYEVEVIKAPIRSYNGHTVGAGQSIINAVSDAKTGKLLGACVFGPDAADRIAAPTRLLLCGASGKQTIEIVCSGR